MNKLFKRLIILAMIACSSLVSAEGFNVTLKDVEMTDFIEQVGKITGKTFVVDQRVRGKITVISNQELPQSAVYELFLAVLQVYGYAAVPDDNGRVIKIIQNSVAKQHAIPLGNQGKRGQELITRVIPILNTPASELVSVLRPMVPSYGHLASANSANALIVIDHASNIRVLESIIDVLDQQKSQDIAVIPLKHAWAPDVVEKVNAFIPSFFGASSGAKGSSSQGVVNVVADERTNRIFIFGESSARSKIGEMIRQFDQPGQETESAQVVKLRYARAKEMADLLTKAMNRNGSGKTNAKNAAPLAPELSIQADEATNSLVVRASTRDMREIRALIDQLDLRRAQILIEAAILEVSANDAKELSTQLISGNEENGFVGANFTGVGTSLNGLIQTALGLSASGIGLSDGITFGAGKGQFDSDGDFTGVEIGAIIQAINSVTKANILSTPSLMTLDNQEASIIVGDNVPFISRSTQQTGSVGNPFVTNVDRRDVGITLKVLPTITDENTVQLEVTQEASQLRDTTANSAAVDVVTSKREINTTILIDDQQTVMLGGLIGDRSTVINKKVPLLGDIPLLGWLFRAKSNTREKTNLIVFLKPTIVRSGETAEQVTQARYSKLRSLQLLVDNNGEISKFINGTLPDNLDDIYFGLETRHSHDNQHRHSFHHHPSVFDSGSTKSVQPVVPPVVQPAPTTTQPVAPQAPVKTIDLMQYEPPQSALPQTVVTPPTASVVVPTYEVSPPPVAVVAPEPVVSPVDALPLAKTYPVEPEPVVISAPVVISEPVIISEPAVQRAPVVLEYSSAQPVQAVEPSLAMPETVSAPIIQVAPATQPVIKVMDPIVEDEDDIVIYVDNKRVNLDYYVESEMNQQFETMRPTQPEGQ